ncbi:MAG TPA: endolytic transglycosylase MltG [Methylocella sp.]|nr:endolytic transglycosylase MltG [Methylocella sp.]
MAFERFPCKKDLVADSWAELMDGTPSKPSGNAAPERPDETLRAETHPRGRFAGQRATPQSPNEALQPAAAPPPPPPIPPSRRRPALSAFSGLLSFLLVVAIASMSGLVWSRHRTHEPGPLAANKVLYITPGTEVPEIIAQLDREGVIDSPFLLSVTLLLEGNRTKVKAGEYLFKQNVSLREVIDTLISGKQVLHAITIPEGLTSEQIVERLRDSDVLLGDITDMPKEGSLLPETYKAARGDIRADIVKKMQDAQKRAVDQIWSRRASGLPLRSPYELVTLASIVEKETGKADERPRVASVFVNRLRNRMRLDSDPTLVYGLAGGKGSLGRGITRADLEKPTPYNTYLIDGLPPGPIANPGRAALEAVANPSRTQDLYFVADGTGGHVFAETLDQHSRNVQRWRQIEKETKDKQEQPAPGLDKTAPQNAPAPTQPGAGQKSESGMPSSVYGSLPASLDAPPSATPARPSLTYAPAASAIAKAMAATGSSSEAQTSKFEAKPAATVSAFTLGPGLDELGISVGGIGSPAATALDGPPGQEDGADAPGQDIAFPISASGRAWQNPRLPPSLAPGTGDLTDKSEGPGTSPAPLPQNGGRPLHARAFDASAGTPFDPLRNKTYDLNYAKTVPAIQ